MVQVKWTMLIWNMSVRMPREIDLYYVEKVVNLLN